MNTVNANRIGTHIVHIQPIETVELEMLCFAH